MLDALADPSRPELAQQIVEALAAEIEGFRVRAVAQAKHAVAQLGQVGKSP